MTQQFRRGVRRASSYYGIGIFAMMLLHITLGWNNKALMPPGFIVIPFLSLAVLPWAFLNLTRLLCPVKGSLNTGEFVIHCLFFLLLSILILKLRQ